MDGAGWLLGVAGFVGSVGAWLEVALAPSAGSQKKARFRIKGEK